MARKAMLALSKTVACRRVRLALANRVGPHIDDKLLPFSTEFPDESTPISFSDTIE